jgi:hypothetical protein
MFQQFINFFFIGKIIRLTITFLLLITYSLVSQNSKENQVRVEGFIQTSGLDTNKYLVTTKNEQYIIESSFDVSKYHGDFCRVYGKKTEYSDDRLVFGCIVINVDSIKRINFERIYSEQDSLVENKIRFINRLYKSSKIDTLHGYLVRTTRFAPDIRNDYAINIDTPIKYFGGQASDECELISRLTINYLDLTMMNNFEQYLRTGKRIKVMGYLISGHAHRLTMVTLKIIN